MKEITLKEAYNALGQAEGLLIADKILASPSCVKPLTGAKDNEFLYVAFGADHEYLGLAFNEGDNKTVLVKDSALYMMDTFARQRSENTKIELLRKQKFSL